jgi:hypothetical protein
MIWPFDLKSGRLPDGTVWQEAPWVHAPPEMYMAAARGAMAARPQQSKIASIREARVRCLAAALEEKRW